MPQRSSAGKVNVVVFMVRRSREADDDDVRASTCPSSKEGSA